MQTTECGHGAGLGGAGGDVTGQEGSFLGVVDLAEHVGDGGIVGKVYDGEGLLRVSLSRRGGGVTQQESDGDDDVASGFEEGVDVLFIVSLLLGLEEVALDAIFVYGILNALPGGGVEGFIVNAANVSDLAGFEFSQLVFREGGDQRAFHGRFRRCFRRLFGCHGFGRCFRRSLCRWFRGLFRRHDLFGGYFGRFFGRGWLASGQ